MTDRTETPAAAGMGELCGIYRAAVEEALEKLLPPAEEGSSAARVVEAMRYSLLAGGKRIRPILTLAFCALGGKEWQQGLHYACAVEMVHTYSLIHDDLPCMDDDDLRRGRPTCHKVYGEDMALLAGDGLLTLAFEAISCCPSVVYNLLAVRTLARCAGYQGMVGGQCLDLSVDGKEVDAALLEQMDRGKTSALIEAACLLGCYAGATPTHTRVGKKRLAAAAHYGQALGLAFQIRDDVLDAQGDVKKLGKNTGMDSAHDKRNYVSLLGVEAAQALVEQYTQEALDALKVFPRDTEFLRDLTLSLVQREN